MLFDLFKLYPILSKEVNLCFVLIQKYNINLRCTRKLFLQATPISTVLLPEPPNKRKRANPSSATYRRSPKVGSSAYEPKLDIYFGPGPTLGALR